MPASNQPRIDRRGHAAYSQQEAAAAVAAAVAVVDSWAVACAILWKIRRIISSLV
jgi:hypothetical protein